MITNNLKLNEQDITQIADIFDMLAHFDFEDAQKHQITSQEIKEDLSIVGERSSLESCEKQDKSSKI